MVALGRLHVVTDARDGRDALTVADAALSAGAPVIQVRAKGRTDRELYDFTVRLVRACRAAGATCLVNDRADVAVAAGAAGVHVGAEDLPVTAVRTVVGPDRIVGGTARDPVYAAALVGAGADYLGVGPVFGTSTKDGLPEPLGPDGIGAVAAAIDRPVVAIGGVTAALVPDLLAAGAYGVAVVSAISDAADPAEATRVLLRALGSVS
jgi:thiamine-phosphate pyrophosphorylase